jgi:dihydroneopterin aldolase
MDQLKIAGLELWAKVGCSEEERSFARPVDMDVTLELPLAEAGKTDDLSRTVDYAAVAEEVRRVAAAKPYRLLEALAEAAADAVRWRFKPAAVAVTARKRALPGLRWAEVTLRRP